MRDIHVGHVSEAMISPHVFQRQQQHPRHTVTETIDVQRPFCPEITTTGESNWQTTWHRGGKISDLVWIGQDVLAWCSGLSIVFFDVPTNKLLLPKFTNDVSSAGISCLSGHFRHRIFAFADKNHEPKIGVYEYPSLTKLSECIEGTNNAYLATAIAGDYLVSLASVPDFKLTVWSWRNGAKISDIETGLHDVGDDGQKLRLSYSMPLFAAQLGSSSGRLNIWDTAIFSTTAILNKTEIHLPRRAIVKDISWCPETNELLAIADRDGHIYLTNPNGSELNRIVLSQRCGVCIEIEPAALCWYQGGIALRTTFCQIRYYHKDNKESWKKLWFVKNYSWPCAITSHPKRDDRLFFATRDGHIKQIKVPQERTSKIAADVKYFSGGIYKFFDLIRPIGDHIVAIDGSLELSVIEARTGAQIVNVTLNTDGKPTCLLSHPDHPMVVVTCDQGTVLLVSLFEYHKPITLAKYKLQSEGLDLAKFSSTGRYLIVANKDSGICYVLCVSVSQSIDIIKQLDVGTRIADIVMFDIKDTSKLYILVKSSSLVAVGHKCLSYNFNASKGEFSRSKSVFYLNKLFQRLEYASRDTHEFVGTPYLSKHLMFYKINDWKSITCSHVSSNAHNLRCVRVITDKKWLVTCGLDGSISVRDANSSKHRCNLHFTTHHKCDFGVTKAVVNSSGDVLIALGADGSLVGVCRMNDDKVSDVEDDDRLKNLLEFGVASIVDHEAKIAEYKEMFDENTMKFLCQPIVTYASNADYKDLTWIEWRAKQKIEDEKKRFAQARGKLILDFRAIKSRVVELLNKNEESFDYEKLPISQFGLNKIYREKRIKSAKDEREEACREAESNCHELDDISGWIRKTYWDSQEVLAHSVFGIFDNTEVTNYTMPTEKLVISDDFDYTQYARSVTKELLNAVTVYPWDSDEVRKDKINSIQLKSLEEVDDFEHLFAIDEEPEVDEEEELNKYLLEGLTTSKFIEPCGNYYSQFETYAFNQIQQDNCNIVKDCKELRLFFNQRFDEIYSMKEREMTLVHERIDRIIHIGSELYTMFNELISENFFYPEWNSREQPLSILEVLDSEISAKPYISPSRQDLLDRKAAEVERRRLERLADDFKERALQDMMDGKMEVRWEDIIKRDPPKPEFMLVERKPESYTDEEVAAIKRYEQEVANIEAERQRYRRLLNMELIKTSNDLRESIDKYNSRLEEFSSLKMYVEAAIQQLNLRYVRFAVTHVNRVSEIKTDELINTLVEQSHTTKSSIEEDIKVIHAVEQELQQKRDNLSAKDKFIEKRLKNEFPNLNKSSLAAISSQFKKRPRLVLKTTSSAEVLDLAKSITAAEKLSHLTTECLDYIKQLEMIEIRSPNLPTTIEDSHWENLVALRRLKIDFELRQHALSLELSAAATSLDECNRKLSDLESNTDSMRRQLKEARKHRNERELNIELQLVLKMGQMEVATVSGDVNEDWKNAVVVPKMDLDRVNEAILIAGKKKVRTIVRSLEFTKSIKVEKWGYECLRTRLKNIGAELYFVRMTNVTRDIREFLRRSAKGLKDDKTQQRMDKEFDLTRQGQEKILKDWQIKLEEVCTEIVKIEKKNKKLDKKVVKLNVDRCDMELKRDIEGETRQKDFREKLVKMAAQRSTIIRKLLAEYEQLLQLRQQRDNINCVGKPLPK